MCIRSTFLTTRSAHRCRSYLLACVLVAGVFGIGTAPAQQLPGDETAQSKKADDKVPSAVRSWGPPLPPPPGTYKSNEVLARDLSPAAHERLRQQGYALKDLGAGLVQITLPPSVDAWAAQRSLATEFQQGFALKYFSPQALADPGSP